MSDFGLTGDVLQQICALIANHKSIQRAVIFGSRAKGNYKKYSDIDICLYGEIDPNEAELIRSGLSELDVIYNFDVAAFNGIKNEELKEHISRCGVEFYSRT